MPISDNVQYLGITFDRHLTFREHILQTSNKAINCGRALYPLLNRKSQLNQKNKLLLYKMCIRPIMTYGCQVWSSRIAKTYMKKLQIIQNKNLKIIFNLPRRYPTTHLHVNYKQDLFNTLVNKLTTRFEDKNRSSNIEILRNL